MNAAHAGVTTGDVYDIRHVGWTKPERVVLPEGAQPETGVVISNRSILRAGHRWLPASREIHFSRLERRQWPLALQLMRAGDDPGHLALVHTWFAHLASQIGPWCAFEQDLGGMSATFPENRHDHPLRWSLRSDGNSGYVFVNNHQPVEPLGPVDGVQFDVRLDSNRIVFPPNPVRIPPARCSPYRSR